MACLHSEVCLWPNLLRLRAYFLLCQIRWQINLKTFSFALVMPPIPPTFRADDRTLESLNITAGATIHMVLQLRGGSLV